MTTLTPSEASMLVPSSSVLPNSVMLARAAAATLASSIRRLLTISVTSGLTGMRSVAASASF
jgi:hypothetical protein